jgi:hypothetical protein
VERTFNATETLTVKVTRNMKSALREIAARRSTEDLLPGQAPQLTPVGSLVLGAVFTFLCEEGYDPLELVSD